MAWVLAKAPAIRQQLEEDCWNNDLVLKGKFYQEKNTSCFVLWRLLLKAG